MIKANSNYRKLEASYLFANIAKKVSEYQKSNPEKDLIKLGIGDVTLPLPSSIIAGFNEGVEEMGRIETFQGYPPYEGFSFLREAIAEYDFQKRGISIDAGEIFVTCGAKEDSANFQEIFSSDIVVAVPDPVYPVYTDSNVMAGRTGESVNGRYEGLVYLDSTEENKFVPSPAGVKADLIYLCFPNNPTGAVATKEQLTEWVDYARVNNSLILFDAAYEGFVTEVDIPRSIYEIEGAKEVAVEFRSYSKKAGFTGTRCGYTVIPKECFITDDAGKDISVATLWLRRQSTKFNGVSYPVQKAAAAIYTPEGQKQTADMAAYYLGNAKIIREAMLQAGMAITGGINSPYIWVKTGGDSWDFFDKLLEEANVVITPGSGFGKCGNGYIRISAFNDRAKVVEAVERITKVLV